MVDWEGLWLEEQCWVPAQHILDLELISVVKRDNVSGLGTSTAVPRGKGTVTSWPPARPTPTTRRSQRTRTS